ncbi:MAG: acylase [Pseudomonadota bacterium]
MTAKRWGIGVLVLVAISLAILGWLAWTPAPPPLDGAAIRAAAARYDVRVIRDAFGVPHIYGMRDADVAFGLGYAHAEDDFATFQEVLAAARGVLARYRGPGAAKTDYLVHLFRIWPLIDARYETDLAPAVKAVLEGYAAGLNLYALEHEQAAWPGLFPVTPQDIVAGFVFRAPFFFGLQQDLAEVLAPTRKRYLSLGATDQAFLWRAAPDPAMGSNAVAVAPARSADGATRLLINSHQPLTGPVAWYEARLKSGEGWDVLGGFFPGAPVMLHGHNPRLGWAHTVNQPDLVDIYALEVDPNNPYRYRFDGAWRDFEVSKAKLRVKLFGPFSWVFERDVLWAAQGPVLRAEHGVYAIAHAGLGDIRQVAQWYAMNKARDLDGWLAAMAINAIPSLNTLYADAAGHLAYIYNMKMPKRAPGYDWRAYLPGDDPRALWQGFEPFSKVPKLIDPPSGLIFNANHTPFAATGGPDELRPADFPESFGIETHFTNRGLRMLALWGADPSISAQAFEAYKFDVAYDARSRVVAFLAPLLGVDFSDDALLKEAQDSLKSWMRSAAGDDDGAALALLTAYKAHWEVRPAGAAAPDPVEALRQAARQLKKHYGRLDVPWREVNRLKRGALNLPLEGGPDTLRAVYGGDLLDGQGQLAAQGGDSYIMIVEWDKEGRLQSRTVHPFGAATLDEASPHYADQAPLFAAKRWKTVPLDLTTLLLEATRDYRPGRN